MGLMMTGLWFLVVNFGIFGLTYHNAWPLLIVGVGLSIMWRAFLDERAPAGDGAIHGGGIDRKESRDGR
jgi:hypothetical protein